MHRPWLTRNVRVLSAVSFLQDAASELLYPLMPIFLTAVLGAPAAVVGLVEGIAEGAASLTKLSAGGLSGFYPRRRLVGLGYGLAALGKLFVTLATAWPVVLAGRVVDRLGKGLRGAPRDALLVDGVEPGRRGRVFGFHRTADTLGAVVGPLLGLAAYEAFDHDLRRVLIVAMVPAVLSAFGVLAVTDHRPPPHRHDARGPREVVAGTLRSLVRPPAGLPREFWRIVAVVVAFSLVNLPDALVLLHLAQAGFTVSGVVLAYVAYNAVYAAASLPAGALADRFGPGPVFGTGLIFFSMTCLGLAGSEDRLVAWLLLAVYGLFAACTDGVGKAWASRVLPQEAQSAGQGYLQGLSGLAVLVAGIWAGAVWGERGTVPLTVAGTVAGFVGIVLLVTALRAGACRCATVFDRSPEG
jgi:MFS family permease